MTQVYSQLAFLSAQWPLSLTIFSTNALRAEVQILFHKMKSKARVIFLFDLGVLSRWPDTIAEVQIDVEVAYGEIE